MLPGGEDFLPQRNLGFTWDAVARGDVDVAFVWGPTAG